MTTRSVAFAALLTLFAAACSKPTPEQQLASAADQAGKALEQAVKDAASGKPGAPVVQHEALKTFLPELAGWTRDEIEGENTEAMGIKVARVQADYEKGDSGLSLEILDCSLNQAILMPFMALAKSGYSETSSEGYTKAAVIGGFPGYEQWSTESKNGEVGVLAGGRFLVKVTGNSVADMATIRKAAESIDLQKLAQLR